MDDDDEHLPERISLLESKKNVRRYGSFLPPSDPKRQNKCYTVEKGDTLAGIAVKFDTSLESLKVLNKVLYYNPGVEVGDKLYVPVVKDSKNDNALVLNDVSVEILGDFVETPSPSNEGLNGIGSILENKVERGFSENMTSENSTSNHTNSNVPFSTASKPKPSMYDFLNKIDSNFSKARSNIDRLAAKSQNSDEQW